MLEILFRFNNQSSYANEYRWLFNNGDSSLLTNPVSSYKNAGQFNTMLIAGTVYASDNTACFDTSVLNIRIVGSRKGAMQVNSIAGNCLPHILNVSCLNTPTANVVWTWGNDSSSTGVNASYRYFTNGQYLVTMTATTAGGCRFTDSTYITVNSPSGKVSVSSKDICLGQSTVLSPVITNDLSSQLDSIRWYPGDGSVITTTVSSFRYQYQKTGIYQPKALLVKASGCLIPLTITDSIRVDQVISKFGLSGVFECGTTTYRFIDSSRSVFGIRSWKWMVNGRDSSYERTRVSRFTQKGSNTTSLIVEGKSGCTATSQANFDVQVYQYPKANISAMAEACRTDLLELKSNINSQDSVALRLMEFR